MSTACIPASPPAPQAPTAPGPQIPCVMQSRFSFPARLLLRWLFGPITYASDKIARTAAVADSGVLVYVTRGHSSWLTLCYNFVLLRAGLPLAAFIGGARFWMWQRPSRLWRAWRSRHEAVRTAAWGPTPPSGRLEQMAVDTVLRGQPAYIALPMPRTDRAPSRDHGDYIRALIFAQRISPKPIYLAPHVLIDHEQSGTARRTLVDRLFGDRRRPGALRRLAMLLTLRQGSVRTADPIDLQAFIAAHPGADDLSLARKIRHEIHWRLNEEERVVAGPRLAFNETMARRILRDPRVRAAIAHDNARLGATDLALEATALKHLRAIMARYDVRIVKLMAQGLNLVFNRIYDGIAVDEANLALVLEASRRGPLIFCPSHRSHIDYLVMSFVLWQQRITPPHIAAGANLSFFPVGHIFRRCGAFFMRRSFRDDPLYAAVLRAYLTELIRGGTAIEFFLEGTRSRSGKFLMPRFGVLSMLVDAWRAGAREDINFVPISIDYERIIEARSFEKELHGADKKAEDITDLLRTTGVLRSRYGRVHLQFGKALSLREVAAEAGLPQSNEARFDGAWRAFVARLGYRILHDIAQVCSVTATAMVAAILLGHPGRGVAQGLLLQRSFHLIAFLVERRARLSEALQHPDTRVSAILEAVQKLVDEGTVAIDRAGASDMEPIYRVPDGKRFQLDFHKNAIMNHFAAAALVCRAALKQASLVVDRQMLHSDCQFLSRLFKKEFVYRVDSNFDTYFNDAVAALESHGLLACSEAQVTLKYPQHIALLALLLDSFVQCYWTIAGSLHDLRSMPLGQRELTARVLQHIRRAFLEGKITRPEAASRSLVDTALAWMREAQIIAAPAADAESKKPTWTLAPNMAPERLQGLADRIGAFVDVHVPLA